MKVAIAGSSGRMGRTLLETVIKDGNAQLAAALEQAGNPHAGRRVAELIGLPSEVTVQTDARAALAGCDVLIDFTRPEGTMAHLRFCRDLGVKLVIGTTGFTDADKREIEQAAGGLAIALSPNFSVGVNVMLKLLQVAAGSLSEGYDVEVVEAHHRHKVDAPSGTALRIGEVLAQSLGRDLATDAIYGRQGVTGERDPKTIGFSTIRGGDVVGDHTVMFLGTGERVEITHKASSRANFAQGAVRAAHFLQTRKSGLYDMWDVLGLR